MSDDALPVILKNYISKDGHGENIFDFEKITPVGDVSDWLTQRVIKWGTKWVGYDLNIGDSAIDFFTAWSPPIPVIMKLAELHKDISFRLEYYETGNAFRGYAAAKWDDGGLELEELCWDMTDVDFEELGLL
jgi:hypothetical protein